MLILLSKSLYLLFIFYLNWFQLRFFSISSAPLLLGLGMLILLIINNIRLKILFPKPLVIWILFAVYCFAAGIFLTSGSKHFIKSWLTYVQIIVLIFYIINLSALEKTNRFFVSSLFLLSLLYLVTMLFDGYVGSGGRLRFSETSNPNSDGMLLFAGIFCLLALIERKNINQIIAGLVLVSLYLYVIIQTGSRKSFLVSLFFLFFWLLTNFKSVYIELKTIHKIILLTMFLFIIYLSVSLIIPNFLESSLFLRLKTKGISIAGDQIRNSMYREAWQMFLEKPFFGIGFKQYENISSFKTYSHSTYAEVISTTGVFGTLLYFSSYFVISINLIKIWRLGKKPESNVAFQYLLLMISMLLLATGVIHFYSIKDNIMFALMISFYEIEQIERKIIAQSSTPTTSNEANCILKAGTHE